MLTGAEEVAKEGSIRGPWNPIVGFEDVGPVAADGELVEGKGVPYEAPRPPVADCGVIVPEMAAICVAKS